LNHEQVILDTGPLVALLCKRDQWHPWAKSYFDKWDKPMISCESVLSESFFLLKREHIDLSGILSVFIEKQILIVENFSRTELLNIFLKMEKFRNIPMSFADACLVQISEKFPERKIFTLDSDFRLYTNAQGKNLSLIIP
jgi:uncharacterized protein